jgi:ribonuclease HII
VFSDCFHSCIITLLKRFHIPDIVEAGCDEAGRGCLAGPVFAAAVVLPPEFDQPLLDDSKKLSPLVRGHLRRVIEQEARAWAVAWLDNDKIDELNILRASIMAMHQALDKLRIRPQHILVDGNYFLPYHGIPHTCVIRGDGKYTAVAAASVLAKTWRDAWMLDLHKEYKDYGWDTNKGYPTAEHRAAIMKYGITPHHRKSFSLFGNQLTIIF